MLTLFVLPSAPDIPPIVPDMTAPGIAGIRTLTNSIAGWAVVGAIAAVVVGVLIAVFGFGMRGARQIGISAIAIGLGTAVVLALATDGWKAVYDTFTTPQPAPTSTPAPPPPAPPAPTTSN